MNHFLQQAFYFIVYAFLGWCAEVAFAAMKQGRFVNRGFLNGPYCPIYGFGAVLVIACLKPMQHNLLLLFIGSCAITTLLEYASGVILERLFQTRWWDYSDLPFNIKGHVCLLFSVIWGLACTFIMRVIDPIIKHLYRLMPVHLLIFICSVSLFVLVLDTAATIAAVRNLSRKLRLITEIADDLHRLSNDIGEDIYDAVTTLEKHSDAAKDWWDDSIRPKLEEIDRKSDIRRAEFRDKLDSFEESLQFKRAEYRQRLIQLSQAMHRTTIEKRILDAYPELKNTRYMQALQRFRGFRSKR